MSGNLKLVDVHCHLDDERFAGVSSDGQKKDLDEVIERAEQAGLKKIVVAGTHPSANRKVLDLAKKYKIVKASFGLYPIDSIIKDFPSLSDDYPREIEKFDYKKEIEWIRKHKDDCVCVGEVGLEFQVIKESKDFEKITEAQIKVFRDAIKLAEEIKKPMVLHTRGGELEVIEILEEMKPKVPIILHCFGGRKSLIKRAAENGFYFSVPAVIKRLLHFQTLVEMVDLKQLLTETDAPYLAPVFGERSEPKDVAVTIKEMARVKNLSEDEVAEQIWENYKKVFGED
jgi:TatD DNase family protein